MLLAILFWRDENNFDKFHKNAPHLYRVVTTLREFRDHQFLTIGGTGQVQGPAFAEAIPEVRSSTRIFGGEFFTNVIAGNKTIRLQPFFVDANFLEVFSFPVTHGSAASALRRGEDVVLTESAALRLFNSTDVIGKRLELDAEPSYEKLGKPLVVSAVIKDPPSNSSLQFFTEWLFTCSL